MWPARRWSHRVAAWWAQIDHLCRQRSAATESVINLAATAASLDKQGRHVILSFSRLWFFGSGGTRAFVQCRRHRVKISKLWHVWHWTVTSCRLISRPLSVVTTQRRNRRSEIHRLLAIYHIYTHKRANKLCSVCLHEIINVKNDVK